MDSQIVEVLGRNRLTEELLRAGLEVALPVRDRGIDLIAYVDRDPALSAFAACPIQMKASSQRSFSLDSKYVDFPNLLLAHVWYVNSHEEEVTFAMTYPEALAVADLMGWTKTTSWANGYYTNTAPGTKLRELLEPYRMTPERWWEKVTGIVRGEFA